MNFFQVNDELVIWSAMTDDEILAQNIHNDLSNQDDDNPFSQLISFKQTRSPIVELSHFLSTRDVDVSVFTALVCIDNVID